MARSPSCKLFIFFTTTKRIVLLLLLLPTIYQRTSAIGIEYARRIIPSPDGGCDWLASSACGLADAPAVACSSTWIAGNMAHTLCRLIRVLHQIVSSVPLVTTCVLKLESLLLKLKLLSGLLLELLLLELLLLELLLLLLLLMVHLKLLLLLLLLLLLHQKIRREKHIWKRL
jgi:hypothetical protein